MTKNKTHCKTCECDKIVRQKPMHRKHSFRESPSYFFTYNNEKKAIYLCEKTISGEQNCWVTKEVVINV